jgi:hypothetical protein
MYLAEFNFGTLRYPWDDPRLADFQNNLDRVNAIGDRSDGFIWRMSSDEMEAEQVNGEGPLKDRPNTASTLSVWTGPKPLYDFAVKTVHAKFMARSHEWFEPDDCGHLVLWWVPENHRPAVAEGLATWTTLQQTGPTDMMFGAAELKALSEGYTLLRTDNGS